MQSKVCGQCFNVQVEAGDVPHGSVLGLVLFNILTAASASLHVALCWVVQLTYLEDRRGCHSREVQQLQVQGATPGSGQP